MRTVDLHIHTACSDGTETPEEIIRHALDLNLAAVSITDHDTMAGVRRAQEAGSSLGIPVIPGIEISTAWHGREIHLLGYFLNPESGSLRPVLEWTVNDRNARNEKIVALLQRDGYHVSMEALRAAHPDTVIGRPHMAEMLLQAGEVESIQDAFNRLLGEGCPYYLPRTYIPFQRAAEIIYAAGGVPVLAHPLQYQFPDEELEALVRTAADCGAVGLEVYYSGYDAAMRAQLTALGDRYGLIYTGGSDYHGTRKPHISLGTGMGHLQVPESAAEALRSAWETHRQSE